MPTKSQSQRGLIFAKRDKYKSKTKTPKKWKWVWDKGWENKGKLPKKAKNETVQNVVFKESTNRAKLVNEDNYPEGAKYDLSAPYNQKDNIIKLAEITKDGEVQLIWRKMIGEDDWEDETQEIDAETMNHFLAHHLNINLDDFYETSDDGILMTDFENLEDGEYKISAFGGEYVTASFEDLENLTG